MCAACQEVAGQSHVLQPICVLCDSVGPGWRRACSFTLMYIISQDMSGIMWAAIDCSGSAEMALCRTATTSESDISKEVRWYFCCAGEEALPGGLC